MSAEPFTALHLRESSCGSPARDEPLCQAAFSRVRGARAAPGGRDAARRRQRDGRALVPGQESFGHVTLRRGMTSTFDLWDWWARVRRGPAVRAICDVVVLSPDLAAERVRFRLHGCLPVKLTGPTLDAMGNDIAIESLELACDGIDIVSPGDTPWSGAEPVAKVQLRELDPSFEREINKASLGDGRRSTPHELRTSFSHELGPSTRLDLRAGLRCRRAGGPRPPGARRRPPADREDRLLRHAAARARRRAGAARRAPGLGHLPVRRLPRGARRDLEASRPTAGPCARSLALSLARPQIAPYAFRGSGRRRRPRIACAHARPDARPHPPHGLVRARPPAGLRRGGRLPRRGRPPGRRHPGRRGLRGPARGQPEERLRPRAVDGVRRPRRLRRSTTSTPSTSAFVQERWLAEVTAFQEIDYEAR